MATLNGMTLSRDAAGNHTSNGLGHTPNGTRTGHLPAHRPPRRMATDGNRRIVWKWESDAFGATPAQQDPDADNKQTVVNLRFPGQYYDVESGLHQNWHRTYDPSLGRYISSDPIGLAGGVNTFGYVGQSPMNFSDPLGLEPNPACVAACTTAGSLIGGGLGYAGGGLLGGFGGSIIPGPGTVAGAVTLAQLGGVAGASSGGIAGNVVGQDACPDDDKSNNPAIPDVPPKNLCEQLALAEAKAGAGEIIMTNLGDEPRLVAHYGVGPWVKMQHKHNCPDGRKLVIHYFHSLTTGENVELKFVNYGSGVW